MIKGKTRTIKGLRADYGLTQQQLAEELNVSVQTIRNWERKQEDGDYLHGEALVPLAIYFGVTSDSLLGL